MFCGKDDKCPECRQDCIFMTFLATIILYETVSIFTNFGYEGVSLYPLYGAF